MFVTRGLYRKNKGTEGQLFQNTNQEYGQLAITVYDVTKFIYVQLQSLSLPFECLSQEIKKGPSAVQSFQERSRIYLISQNHRIPQTHKDHRVQILIIHDSIKNVLNKYSMLDLPSTFGLVFTIFSLFIENLEGCTRYRPKQVPCRYIFFLYGPIGSADILPSI